MATRKSVGKQIIDGFKDFNKKLKAGKEIPCTTLVKYKAWAVFDDDGNIIATFNEKATADGYAAWNDRHHVEPVFIIRDVKKAKARTR